MHKIILVIYLFVLSVTFSNAQQPAFLPCNSYEITRSAIIDTTVGSLSFNIVDSLNKPVPNIDILIEGVTFQLEDKTSEKYKMVPYTVGITSDSKGNCGTTINGLSPLDINFRAQNKDLYQFHFSEKMSGRAYWIRVKLCMNN